MIRNLKLLAMTAVVALALTAGLAGNASADVFTAEATPLTLTGAQEGTSVGAVSAGSTQCTTLTYVGTISASPTSSITLTPTYGGCTFVGLAASIKMNGCDYVIRLNGAAGNTSVTTDIVCPAGQEITKTAPAVGTPKCIIHIPSQANIGVGTVTNVGAGATRELTFNLLLTGITYHQTTGTAETGNCETKEDQTNGTFTGKILLTGESEPGGSHLGVFAS